MTRNRKCWIALSLVFLAMTVISFAYAQETDAGALCRQIQAHGPKGADYVPGVDVHGREVVSADLNALLPAVHDPIVIPVDVDLAQRFGLGLGPGMEITPEVARIEVYQDGRIVYNGEDVTNGVYGLCAADGQASPDDVPFVSETRDEGKDIIKGRYPDEPSYND